MPRHLEAQIFDHSIIFVRCLPIGCQIVAHKYRICRVEPQGLQTSQVNFATACDSQFTIGVDQSEHRERLQAIVRCEFTPLLKRGSLDRDQEVEGNRLDLKVPQRHRHLNQVLILFTHADDAAAAKLHTRSSDRV